MLGLALFFLLLLLIDEILVKTEYRRICGLATGSPNADLLYYQVLVQGHLNHDFLVRGLPSNGLSLLFRNDLEARVSFEEAREEELALVTRQDNLYRIGKDLQCLLL